MVELTRKKSKSFPKINLKHGKKEVITPIITNSMKRHNDPYMPNISQSTPCSSNRYSTRLHRSRAETPQIHHHHHYYYLNTSSPILDRPIYTYSAYSTSPPLSPPPLSPSRPSWRNMRRTTWQPTPSISSSEDDDNQPIGLLTTNKSTSLLSDKTDGDDELIPIAGLLTTPFMSAAEKYKAKVKSRLFLNQ